MSKYLETYISTIPVSNRNKLNSILKNDIESQKLVSVGEYNYWYNHMLDVLNNNYFQPTTVFNGVLDESLITSELHNYLLKSIEYDLVVSFTEANALFDFINYDRIKNERIIDTLNSDIYKVLSDYFNLFYLRQHGSTWSKGFYVNFNAGGALFLPYGYNLKDNLYIDYNGNKLESLDIVYSSDNNKKLILGSYNTTYIQLMSPEIMWDEFSTQPDYTLKTGTDIFNSIDDDDLSQWVEVLCFENLPVINSLSPTIENIHNSSYSSNAFSGYAEIKGTNIHGKYRTYYIKFINKGITGEAQYICSDDGVHYTNLVCKNDLGEQCKYNYNEFYSEACKNTQCLRYTQTGAVTTQVDNYTPVYNSHNEDTGFEVKFVGTGIHYPGDIWKLECPCSETYGATLRYTVKTKCNTLSNWLEIKPITDFPFIIDSIQYYDELNNIKYLVSQQIYVNNTIRIEYEPRIITRFIINMRQENYINTQYNIDKLYVKNNELAVNVIDSDKTNIDTTTVNELLYNKLSNSKLRDLLFSTILKNTNDILKRNAFCYVFGLSNLTVGYTEYQTVGRNMLKPLAVRSPGIIRLNTVETYSDISNDLNYSDNNVKDTRLCSIEYDLFIKNYNTSGGWVNSIEVPIIPYVRSYTNGTVSNTILNEHLRISDNIGKLRFFSKSINYIYSVYNQEYLIEDTDYTIIQQEDVVPYITYIDLSDYIMKKEKSSDLIFVVSYIPERGVFLDKTKLVYIDTDSCQLKLNLDKNPIKIDKSDIYLMITARRNTYNKGITPKLFSNLHLLVGEIDEYKYYPEGNTNEEFRTELLTDSTSVK